MAIEYGNTKHTLYVGILHLYFQINDILSNKTLFDNIELNYNVEMQITDINTSLLN